MTATTYTFMFRQPFRKDTNINALPLLDLNNLREITLNLTEEQALATHQQLYGQGEPRAAAGIRDTMESPKGHLTGQELGEYVLDTLADQYSQDTHRRFRPKPVEDIPLDTWFQLLGMADRNYFHDGHRHNWYVSMLQVTQEHLDPISFLVELTEDTA